MFSRRKPQNLTPPGGSDGGSSGSGQSPTSTHPGSPPPPITSSKRPGYVDGADGLPTKRQRISHYRKPSEQIYRSPVENNSQRRPMTDSRDAININPRSSESPPNGYNNTFSNGFVNGLLNNKHNSSDDEESTNRKRMCDSHSLSFGLSNEKTFSDGSLGLSPAKSSEKIRSKEDILDRNGSNNVVVNGRSNEDERERSRWNNVSSSSQHRVARVSPDSQSERISATDTGPPPINTLRETNNEFPDYLT